MWSYNLAVREAVTERKKRDGSKRQWLTVNAMRKTVGTSSWTRPSLNFASNLMNRLNFQHAVGSCCRPPLFINGKRRANADPPAQALAAPPLPPLKLSSPACISAVLGAVCNSSIHLFFKK